MSRASDPVLITGCAGLVGRAIRRSLTHTCQVLGTSRASGDLIADLLAPEALGVFDRPFSTVIHCASVLPDFDGDPRVPNAQMTRNLLRSLERTPPLRFVQISSASVYAIPVGLAEVCLHEDATLGLGTAYGISKQVQESLVSEWCKERSIPLTILRLSGVYGPGQRGFGALPIFWERARGGQQIEIHAPRNYVQNYVSSADVAAVVALVLKQQAEGVFNLFSNETLSMLELAHRICAFVGDGKVLDKTSDEAYPRVLFDRSRLDSTIEHPFQTLEEGLECLT